MTVTIALASDDLYEADETFLLVLSDASNAGIADGVGVGTLTNDDVRPTLTTGDVTLSEPTQGQVMATITLTLSAASGVPVLVDLNTSALSARHGLDFAGATTVATIDPGTTSATFSVPVLADDRDEPDESFVVRLAAPSGADLASESATITIVDVTPTPTLAVTDVTLAEGDSGTSVAEFVVALSAPSDRTITVAWTTADGTATGGDYTAASGVLTFAPGVTTTTVRILVTADLLSELDETFFVRLSSPSHATLSDGEGVATIHNDDLPMISVGDVEVTEGPGVTATFTVRLSLPSTLPITVQYATADSTATTSDYTPRSGTLTFDPNQTELTVTVPIANDSALEPGETFFVVLTNPTNAELNVGRGRGFIIDDDTPTASLSAVAGTVGETGTARFRVTLSTASPVTTTVLYTTEAGTATAGSDFTAATNFITFAPGETAKEIDVAITADALDEADETFNVRLVGAMNASLGTSSEGVTVLDDDAAPSVSIADAAAVEGGLMTFSVTLSAPSGRPITVRTTAAASADQAGTDEVITFNPGETTKGITVVTTQDALDEDDEAFIVTLSNPVNVTLADALASGTILDNDEMPTVSISDATITEGGQAEFTVTLSAPSGREVRVGYSLAGTDDYTGVSNMLVLPEGVTSRSFSVQTTHDPLDENEETFTVLLTSPHRATLDDFIGQGTIIDDDRPEVIITPQTVTERGDGAAVTVTVTARLARPNSQPVTILLETADASAQAGSDYTGSSQSFTLMPGQTAMELAVTVASDRAEEVAETFRVRVRGAQPNDGEGAVSVLNAIPEPAYLVLSTAGSLPGVASYKPHDILKVVATPNPSGGWTPAWARAFVGARVGLSTAAEAIDAFTFLPPTANRPIGSILVSTVGAFTVATRYTVSGARIIPSSAVLKGKGNDILQFTPTGMGDNTAGTWSIFARGSWLGLTTAAENVDGLGAEVVGQAVTQLYLSTRGNYAVPGLSGAGENVLRFSPTTPGRFTPLPRRTSTSGTFTTHLRGSDFLGAVNTGENVDAFFFGNGGVYLSLGPRHGVTGAGVIDVPGITRADVLFAPSSGGPLLAAPVIPASALGLSASDIRGLWIRQVDQPTLVPLPLAGAVVTGTDRTTPLPSGRTTVDVWIDPAGAWSADETAAIRAALAAVNRTVPGVNFVESRTGMHSVVIGRGAVTGGRVAQAVGSADAGQVGGEPAHVLLSDTVSWYAGPGEDVGVWEMDLLSALLHEMGHLLGLGHSNDPRSPMDSTLALGEIRRTFTDVEGAMLQSLYDPTLAAERVPDVVFQRPLTLPQGGPFGRRR